MVRRYVYHRLDGYDPMVHRAKLKPRRRQVAILQLADLNQEIAEWGDFPIDRGDSDQVHRIVAVLCDLYEWRDELERRVADAM